MKRTIIIILVLLTLVSVVLATNHVPPTLTNFEQFYGSVTGISATGFKIRAQIGTAPFVETPIASNGQYGYSPTFKVYGQNNQNGNPITFFIVNAQGIATPANTTETAYQNMATTRLDFSYAAAPPDLIPATCGNNVREGSEACDGTDLAGQTCTSNVGVGSTGALNCTSSCAFNTTQCTASTGTCWECHDWGRCRNNRETRTCGRVDCTVPGALRVEPADERFCPGNQTTSSSSSPSTCTMSWECSAWSVCRSAQQTRICFRADNCDTLLEQRQITSVTSALKPTEEKSCQETITTTSQQICDPGMKRCLGPQLQLCSTDGLQWATLQTCPSSCDPISLTCRIESTPPPSTQTPSSSSSLWVYLLVGSIVLVLVIVSISMALLNKKKYAPAKEYIQENRARGIDDEQIREKLVDEGWDEKGVGKLFK